MAFLMKKHAGLALICALGLIGCNEQQPQEQAVSQSTQTNESTGFVSKLPADAPVIKVAMTGLGAPFSYKDSEGFIEGADVDIIRGIGELEGFKVDIIPESWANIFDKTEEGVYDATIAGISWTPERASRYGLSDGYVFNPASFIYKADSAVHPKTIEDLVGLRVGVLQNSKHEKLIENQEGINKVITESGFESLKNLARGDIDVYIHDNINLRQKQAGYADYNFEITSFEDEAEKSAYLVIVTQKDNQELLNKLNDGIAKLKAEGKIDEILNYHLEKTSTEMVAK